MVAPFAVALFGRARARLLHALAPAREGLHVRALARAAGLGLNSTQRELARLAGAGIVAVERVGNRAQCRLSPAHAASPALAALLGGPAPGEAWLSFAEAGREAEESLLALCTGVPPAATLWRQRGEPEFLSGVALMLASHRAFDRTSYLALGEALAPGASEPQRFGAWLMRTWVSPARFFPMLEQRLANRGEAG